MARGSAAANTAATSAQNTANTLGGNAQGLYAGLAPELETEATHPAGYSPTDLAKMNTAAQQSAGGSEAAAVGQGALLASRTRNAGAPGAAISSAARGASEDLSKRALDVQNENANLKQKQQQAGLSGLEGLYGTNVSGANTAQGQVAPAVEANTAAQNASWDWATDLFDPLVQAGSKVGSAALGG